MTDTKQTHLMTSKEAVALFKRLRGKGPVTFYLGASKELPIAGSDNQCFPGYGIVTLTIGQACKYVVSVAGDVLERRGGRIKIEVDTRTDYRGRACVNVWL